MHVSIHFVQVFLYLICQNKFEVMDINVYG